MKVTLARKEAEAFRDVYNKYEPGEGIEADYTTADNLEHALRKHALLKKVEKDWLKYNMVEKDNYSLLDYAEDILKRLINEKKENQNKR